MSAITFLGATQQNASVAGNTSSEPAEPTAQGPTWQETIMSGIGTEYGGLSHLFEAPVRVVDTDAEIPTDSIRGRLGGLIPKLGSVVAPGPTSTPDSAKPETAPTVNPGAGITGYVAKARSWLRV